MPDAPRVGVGDQAIGSVMALLSVRCPQKPKRAVQQGVGSMTQQTEESLALAE